MDVPDGWLVDDDGKPVDKVGPFALALFFVLAISRPSVGGRDVMGSMGRGHDSGVRLCWHVVCALTAQAHALSPVEPGPCRPSLRPPTLPLCWEAWALPLRTW